MGRTGETIGYRWMVNVSRVYRQTGKLVENTISRRLRGFLSLDGRLAHVIGWVVFERADALLLEALASGDPRRRDAASNFVRADDALA
jgi:hypothetical protein